MTEDSAQFNTLIKKRGSIKASLTHLKKFIDSLKDKVALDDLNVMEIQQKMPRFDGVLANFNEIQDQIELLSENVEEQYEERENFVNDLDRYVSIARNLIKKQKLDHSESSEDEIRSQSAVSAKSSKKSVKLSSNASDEFVLNTHDSGSDANEPFNLNNIKLPTIELPKYDGRYEAWLEFRDTFESLIHKNMSISNIQKFHYLRASLQGEAAEVIRSIEFCSDNYENAYKSLKERYDNTRLLIHNHLQSIFSIKELNRESAHDIRNLSDTVFKHLRSLKQLGEEIEK